MKRTTEYYAPDWKRHIMGPSSGQSAFVIFEDIISEEMVVQEALDCLVQEGMIQHSAYDKEKFRLFQEHVFNTFDIPWTGISPRARRLIYAINALRRPRKSICAGIFCGYTYICNAGASIGPGKCYNSDHIIGLEILNSEAERAKHNVSRFAPGYENSIVCSEAASWISNSYKDGIDLLYIDAKSISFDPKDKSYSRTEPKSEYLKIIQAAYDKLNSGALILAHNSVNAEKEVADYLSFVRSDRCRSSVNAVIDDAGLEVSMV